MRTGLRVSNRLLLVVSGALVVLGALVYVSAAGQVAIAGGLDETEACYLRYTGGAGVGVETEKLQFEPVIFDRSYLTPSVTCRWLSGPQVVLVDLKSAGFGLVGVGVGLMGFLVCVIASCAGRDRTAP